MSTSERSLMRLNRGVGLIEVMISIIIAMLLVLVIYQVYEISEGQKRTITAGSDAQQNASYGLYALGRDLAMAGNGIASAHGRLHDLPLPGPAARSLRPIPGPHRTPCRCRRSGQDHGSLWRVEFAVDTGPFQADRRRPPSPTLSGLRSDSVRTT